jgi:dolichyl-phosphate-mannose--protein O-mannosyl transferase
VYLGGGIGQPIVGAPDVKIADEGTWVHPPLGKWIIALLGVGPIGQRAIGWRLPSAVFGIAGVGLLYLLALRLWGSVWWAGCASLLLALDGLHIVQSRIAMLDIFLTTFVTAAIYFLVLDRERMHTPRPVARWRRTDRFFGSPYRLWAGVSLGAAVATKWSGAFALPFAAALCGVWALGSRRNTERPATAIVGTLVASFVLVPVVIYLLSYGAFFYQHGLAVDDFVKLQLAMLDYQRAHGAIQPENSLPWTWPLLLHPILYFSAEGRHATSAIVALGNPALWWGFLTLLPFGIWGMIRHPTWQDAVTFGGYAAMFLPWFAIGRSQFIWYMLPAVPFMCLGVAASLRRFPPSASRRLASAITVATILVVAMFAPVWTGWRVPSSWVGWLGWLPDWPL